MLVTKAPELDARGVALGFLEVFFLRFFVELLRYGSFFHQLLFDLEVLRTVFEFEEVLKLSLGLLEGICILGWYLATHEQLLRRIKGPHCFVEVCDIVG